MRTQTQINAILNYFSGFSYKDMDKVSRDFDESVTLKDWNIHVAGKENVKNAIQSIFDTVESISISPISLYISENDNISCVVTARIEILVNESEILNVVDIISLTKELEKWKITSIDAYKQ